MGEPQTGDEAAKDAAAWMIFGDDPWWNALAPYLKDRIERRLLTEDRDEPGRVQ